MPRHRFSYLVTDSDYKVLFLIPVLRRNKRLQLPHHCNRPLSVDTLWISCWVNTTTCPSLVVISLPLQILRHHCGNALIFINHSLLCSATQILRRGMRCSLQPIRPTLYPSALRDGERKSCCRFSFFFCTTVWMTMSRRVFCKEASLSAATIGFWDSFSTVIIRQRLERQAKNGQCVCLHARVVCSGCG